MAEKFQPQTFDINSINKGDKFTLSDGIEPEAVNAPIEAAAYIQSLATNQPNIENANKIGTPKVSIELAPNGTPRFKFEELKGKDHSQEISAINSNITAIRKEQSEQNSQIESNKKEVHNIKQALLQNEVLVVSKIKNKTITRVTAGGENIVDDQYTAVTEIKGSTVRNENLIPYPYKNVDGTIRFPYVREGVTFTNDNGVITANGTAGSYGCWFHASPTLKVKPSTKYFLSGCPSGGSMAGFYMHFNGLDESGTETYSNANDIGNGVSFTTSATTTQCVIYIVVVAGTTITNKVFKPLLVEAETGIWTPPFSDLKRANISAIKSTGRNLFDKSKAKDGYEIVTGATGAEDKNAEWFVTALIPVLPNKQYKITGKPSGSVVTQYDINKKPLGDYGDGGSGFWTYSNAAFVKLNGKLTEKDTFQLEIGTTASEYTPYTEEIYQLPETLELGEWDSFNPQTGEIIRQTRRVQIDNTLGGWGELDTGDGLEFVVGISDIPEDSNAIQAVCNLYKSKTRNALWASTSAGVSASKNYLRFKDPNFADLESFRTYAQSLADAGTPMIVDIKVAPTIEKIENAPKLYKAWNKGSETVIQGETDNSEYGAMPKITNEYILKIGGETE